MSEWDVSMMEKTLMLLLRHLIVVVQKQPVFKTNVPQTTRNAKEVMCYGWLKSTRLDSTLTMQCGVESWFVTCK